MKYILSILFTINVFAILACPSVSVSSSDVACSGGFTGQVNVTVTGGNGPFNISWSIGGLSGTTLNVPSGTTTPYGGLPAGVFQVYVVDQLGCTSIQVITVYEPDEVTGVVNVTDVLCNGALTGEVDLTVSGGTAPYTYNWSNGVTNEDNSNVGAGTYSVIVTDQNGCSSSSTISGSVSEPAQAVQASYNWTDVLCAFGNTGSVDLSVWGGTSPYSYDWNGGAFATEDISGLPSGNYTVNITDANGCLLTESVTVSEPTQLISTISGTDVLCFNGSDGTINLSPNGGTVPYSFSWTNSTFTLGTNEDLTNISADDYTVTITDNNGCTATNNYTVNQPQDIITSLSSTNVSCNGYADGAIDLFVSGGTPNYVFSWSNSGGVISVNEDLSSIAADDYSVTVTDDNGCVATDNVTITEPLTAVEISYSTVDVLCNGDNTGEIDITVTGGTPGYSYSWSNASNSEDIELLVAGTYQVTVQDALGCIDIDNIIITEPSAPLSSSKFITNVLCNGESNGEIDYTVSGGTIPYTYSWVNSSFSLSDLNEDLIGYPADTFVVTVMDGNGCSLIDTSVIEEPELLEGSFTMTDVLCFGDSTGEIDLEVTGGTIPYGYDWSNNAVVQDINQLTAGIYSVIVTDANGCVYTNNGTLVEPITPLSGYYFMTEPKCPAGNDGEIQYTIEGGTLPYDYFWSNFETNANIYNLNAGLFYLQVTDGNGCRYQDSVIVTDPLIIEIQDSITHVLCNEGANGSIDISVSGGTAPYDYEWTNSTFVMSIDDEDIFGYVADDYTITVTDDNGCVYIETFEITEPSQLESSVQVQNISCAGGNDGAINLTPIGATPDYSFIWSNGSDLEDLENIASGVYTYQIFDVNGCSISDSVEVTEPFLIEFNPTVTPVSCSDQSDGTIFLDPTGGYGEYNILWENGSSDNPLENLSSGYFSVTVTDLVGCERDTTIFVPGSTAGCINITNTITPNDDGINDVWYIENIYLYSNTSVSIYNQWGKRVYEVTGGYNNDWNGTFRGNALPAATYYYVIDLNNGTETFTGPITIVR